MIFGSPESIETVATTIGSRFRKLNDREVDVLVRMDTHTIAREVQEVRFHCVRLPVHMRTPF